MMEESKFASKIQNFSESERPSAPQPFPPKPVEQYTASDMVGYFNKKFKERHGYPVQTVEVKSIGIMQTFMGKYRKREVKDMIDIIFDEGHDGYWWNEIVTIANMFGDGCDSKYALVYHELKENQQKEKGTTTSLHDARDWMRMVRERNARTV